MNAQPPIVASDAAVYYQPGYWNDHPFVAAEMNRRISGRADRTYLDFFVERTGRHRFARALFLNCGSGWVERDFCARGLIDSGIGIDYSEALLSQAREAAAGLPLRYVQMDINAEEFPDERFDLVVNFAAGHHIANVDRVYRQLCRQLTADGMFLNYDYVGPHRNQYPYEQWSAVWELNRSLPPEARQVLSYPHLPTMLATDPSEAIHSELTLGVFERYFSVHDYRWIGGPLAYPLISFNAALAALDPGRRDSVLESVMQADAEFTRNHPHLSLFAYWYGRPRHGVLDDQLMLDRWAREESAREAAALENGGRYYPCTLLEDLIYPAAATPAAAQDQARHEG